MPCYKKPIREAAKQESISRLSYVGGFGAGRGWLQTDFLVSAEELRTLLLHYSFKLCVTNSRLSPDYVATALDDYIRDYATYVDHIFSGEEFIREKHYRFPTPMYMSLFLDDEEICFENFVYKGEEFKRVLLAEPRLYLSPCMISWSGKSLSLRTGNEKGYFGLSLTYPRVYFSSEDGFCAGIDTEGTAYRKLYNEIVTDLKSFSRGHRFAVGERTIRPKLLIADSTMDFVNRHWYLRSGGIRVL